MIYEYEKWAYTSRWTYSGWSSMGKVLEGIVPLSMMCWWLKYNVHNLTHLHSLKPLIWDIRYLWAMKSERFTAVDLIMVGPPSYGVGLGG